MKRITALLVCMECLAVNGQRLWTMEQCMQYAVSHNYEVRMQSVNVSDYQIEKVRQTAAFLPYMGGSVGAQYNFGRAIDPETNTYTDVSTFYNSYALSASLPVFDGFQRLNDLRAARANLLMGRNRLQAQKDATAQRVMQSYIQVLYYRESIAIARQKQSESHLLLQQTRKMAEVGRKSEADVAQIQAVCAADDYEVTRQESFLENALLQLKQQMNYPIDHPLEIVPPALADDQQILLPADSSNESSEIYAVARQNNPEVKLAEYGLRSAKYAYRSSLGALFPSLTVGAGVSTTYYKQLHVVSAASFREQFRNNAGEYVYATLSIPLFNRLNTLSNIRRQRNNVKRAEEELSYRHNELQRLIREALTDLKNCRKEAEKMRLKVEADSMAAHLTSRQYEEGLASTIDVQTSATALLQSRAQLLQCRLTYLYKIRMLNYYKGVPLWIE